MNTEDDEYIEKLYTEFLDALNAGTERDFDLDELLEIHDFANDIEDGYVSFMSLSEMLRRNPDDVEVNERLALYFYHHNETGACYRQLEILPEDNFIRQLLTVALNPLADTDEICGQLDHIVEGREAGSLTDEDVIRLIDVVRDLSMTDWAAKNYRRLKTLAEFPDTLMNELAKILRQPRHDAVKRQILEEFTAAYPFNASAWMMLADHYTVVDNPDYEEAEAANDYALAIDPDNYDVRARQFDLMMQRGASVDELMPVLDGMIEKNPDSAEKLYAHKAQVYYLKGMTEQALATVRKGLSKYKQSVALYDTLLKIKDGDVDTQELIDAFSPMGYLTLTQWQDLLYDHLKDGEIKVAGGIAALLVRQRNHEESMFTPLKIMKALYMSGRYEDVVNHISFDGDTGEAIDMRPMLRLIYFLSLKRLGRVEQLEREISGYTLNEDVPEKKDTEHHLALFGIWLFIVNLKASLRDSSISETEWDPFLS